VGDHLDTHFRGFQAPMGMAFSGDRLAVGTKMQVWEFIGLSQVRESAVFSGIAITERLTEEERTCDVCVIDLRNGQVIALLRFETAVQEVLAVIRQRRTRPALPGADQRRRAVARKLVRGARRGAGRCASLRGHAEPTRGAAGSGGKGSGPRRPFVTE
jgi:hypothetical protein